MSSAPALAAIPTHSTAIPVFEEMRSRVREKFAPPPDITVSEWSRRNRVLPKGTSSRPGEFRPQKFQIEMMDAILDPHVHEVVCMKSTQIGWSDAILNNLVGFWIDVDPAPMMLVQPTIDNAKDYGKKRIAPMIRSAPALRAKIRESKSRDGGNTLTLKEFPGGFLKLTGANAGTGLRSDPVPRVLFDEVDGFPLDVDGEGDPVEIGRRRTDQYPDWKILQGSTPAKPKGFSRIEKAFERSDQRRFHVPCPHCGAKQVLSWRDPESKEYRLAYEVDADGQVVAGSVAYICAMCKGRIQERYKQQMLDAGEWIARFPGRPIVGFHINALYSPWRENWRDFCQEWHEATSKGNNPEKLKAFINLRLAETWEEEGDSLEAHVLRARVEKYPEDADFPDGVGLITASGDVQGDRIEVAVKGWGAGQESWLIAYQQFFGDPGRDEVWNDVDEFLLTEFRHPNGRTEKISATMIDSGGHHTEAVYKFVKARQARRVFALKGASESGQPILSKFSLNNSYRVKLYTIGTDTAKDLIFARMKIPRTAGSVPGFMHLPDWIDDEYLEQLTSEKRVPRYKRGRGIVPEYVKTRTRNEALDLEVYALAALHVLGNQTLRRLEERAETLSSPPTMSRSTDGLAAPSEGGPSEWTSSGSSWVNGWRE